jgi:hypothetical protein
LLPGQVHLTGIPFPSEVHLSVFPSPLKSSWHLQPGPEVSYSLPVVLQMKQKIVITPFQSKQVS